MWPVAEVELPGRGRGLVAARDIRAGETVLAEDPVLLFVQPAFADSSCAQCLRTLAPGAAPLGCDSCASCRFCCAECAAAATAAGGAHAPDMCAALRALKASSLEAESQHLARFLLQAYALKAAAVSSPQAAAQFAALWQLVSRPVGALSFEAQLAQAVHPMLLAAYVATGRLAPGDVAVEEVAELLAKEAANGFCVMASAAVEEERSVRGTGIFLQASRINHACFPNVARFDYFDAAGSGNTRISFRAMDPIPQGSELLMSYFPVSLPRAQRQRRLQVDYGFACSCARCEVEDGCAALEGCDDASASGMEASDDGSSDSSSGDDAEHWEQGGEGYSVEYSLWMLKFLCQRDGCGGTLAPPNPTADVMECNYCGCMRTDAEFYEHLQAV